jgi:hypothetical protein
MSRRWSSGRWSPRRRRLDVPCVVDIEQTPDSFYAHAIAEGIDIRPGDIVIVHGAPGEVPFGERMSLRCRATVVRANLLGRAWARFCGLLTLTELYEVGFEPRH